MSRSFFHDSLRVIDKLSALLCLLMQQTVADTKDEASEREREKPGGKREWMDITSPDRVTVTSKSWMVEAILALHRIRTGPPLRKGESERERDRSSLSLWG